MNNALIPIVSVVMSGLTLIAVLALAICVHCAFRKRGRKQESQLSRIATNQEYLANATDPLGKCSQPLDSVVTRLSFSDSLDSERFAMVSHECALSQINSMLASNAGDGFTLTVNAIQLCRSNVELTVAASKHGQKLLEEGTAVIARQTGSGRALPLLKDAKTGRFTETMKEVRAKKTLSRLSAMSGAVVGAAHMISGADVSKRLKIVDQKLDLLLAYRQIDQLARLERIYSAAKELGYGPMTSDKRWELWRLRGELREMRCTWRRELLHHLSSIGDPKSAHFLKRIMSRQKSIDQAVYSKTTEGELQVGLIEYSMRLEHVLAIGAGMIEEHEGTLGDELHELRRLADTLRQKADFISDEYPNLSAQPMVKTMNAIIEGYESLLPERLEPAIAAAADLPGEQTC